MKILHVAESIKGGVGTYLNQVVPPQIAEFGTSAVRVIAPAQHAIQIPSIDKACITTFDRPNRSPRSLLRLWRCFAEEVSAFKPDIVHAQSTFSGAIVRTALAVKRPRPIIVYCPHGWVFNTQLGRWSTLAAETAEATMARFCDAIVAISAYEANEGRRIGIPNSKLKLVYNGISSTPAKRSSLEWNDSRLRILFIGRLDRQKGLDILIEAVRDLQELVHVRVVGEAILTGNDAIVCPSNVEMLGWRGEADIEALLQRADIVAMPSRWEGFGLAAIEAMRAGRPVLASSVGGLPEVVADGATGRLVPPGDPRALREALITLDPATRQAMGSAGRARFIEHFTVERTHDQLVSLYRRLLAGEQEQLPAPLPKVQRAHSND